MSKKTANAIATTLFLLIAFSTLSTMLVQAQTQYKNLQPSGSQSLPAGVTPDIIIEPDAYLSFRPNPIGVGQTILVNIWTDPGPSVTRYLSNFKVTITKPDGTKDEKVMNSYFADSTAWFEYVVDQTGTWKLKFEFPGGYFPPGNYTLPSGSNAGYTDSLPRSCYYKPASTPEQTLIVQQDPVLPWPVSPLPTDYWTRPVMKENREWASILGNYPWQGPGFAANWPADTSNYWNDRYSFVPYVQAPNTAHIVWKRMGAISGIKGGDYGTYSDSSSGGNPSIIYQGICYQTLTKPMSTTINGSELIQSVSVWQCYDLRTGEVYWEQTGIPAPTAIEYSTGDESVPGASASVGVTTNLIAISSGRLLKYNPSTGAITANVSISPLSSATYYMNGYALSIQNLGSSLPFAQRYRLINWTTFGTSSTFTSRVMNNVSWQRSDLPQFIDYGAGLAFNAREPNIPLTLGAFPFVNILADNATAIRHGMRIEGYSMITGQVLYNVTYDDEPITAAQAPYGPSNAVADHGKFAVLMRNGIFNVYEQTTGKLLFKTERMDYPWDAPGFGAYASASAYGQFYHMGYGGIYAFDWDTGKIVWKYSAPAFSEYETPYTDEKGTTVYSFNAGVFIGDGKIYATNTEHSPTQPITRGWGLHCINATTGELIWKTKTAGSSVAADGYLSVSASDGYQYVYGKGKTQTTVTAPDTILPKGTGVVIKGTVLDMSPAQSATPCVSKDSMTTQMEYLHLQQPIDGLWHNETISGVPVTLTAVGSDGSYIDLGIVTTDGYYGTFSKTWTPDKEGDYKIIASFAGDDSYGSSGAATAISVGPAPATDNSGQQQEIVVPDYTMTILGVGIAIIIAVAIVGALLFITLRKR